MGDRTGSPAVPPTLVDVTFHERGDFVAHVEGKVFVNTDEVDISDAEILEKIGKVVSADSYSYTNYEQLNSIRTTIKRVAKGYKEKYRRAKETRAKEDLNKAVATYCLEDSATLVEGVLEVAANMAIVKGLTGNDKYEIAKLLLMAEGLRNA